MPYQSVGGAATGALLDALAERERSKQQALQNQRLVMQDQLARDKEAREAQYQRDEIANRQQQLAQDEAKAKAGEERAKANDFRSHLDNSYIGGDIITDAGTAAEALQYTPDRIQVKQDPGAVGPVPEGQMPVGSAIRILPNKAERAIAQAKAESQQADQVLAQKYGGPEGLVRARANPLETEMDFQAAHKTVPVSLLAEPKPTTKTLNVRDPDTGKVLRSEEVPIGTEDHFLSRPTATGAQANLDVQNVAEAVKGMADHSLPPALPSRGSREYIALLGEAHRQGVDLVHLNEDWSATQRYLSTMNGAQQVRFRQAVKFANDSIPIVETLIKEWDGGSFPTLNRVQLEAAKQGALGPKAASIATRLDAQIADMTSELGTVYKGGNASTDESLRLAAKNLQGNWSRQVALDALKQIKQNITVRDGSIRFGQPIANEGNVYAPRVGPLPADTPTATSAPKVIAQGPKPPKDAAVGDTWQSPRGPVTFDGKVWKN